MYVSFLVVFLFCFNSSLELNCKNDEGKDVDWFINYKLPKVSEHLKSFGGPLDGKSYMYLTSNETAKWHLSSKKITSKKSMLGRTWGEVKKNDKKNSYLFYNDQPPTGDSSSKTGHMKGFLIFDGESGIWVTHSIPKFGEIGKYKYPETAYLNGQYIFCVSYPISELDKICLHLLNSRPHIYHEQLSKDVSPEISEIARTLFSDDKNFTDSEPVLKKSVFTSSKGLKIKGFAKNNKLQKDIYSDVIAPSLKTSLLVSTWRRGAGGKLPISCRTKYDVMHINRIVIDIDKYSGDKKLYFETKKDHSKWAISLIGKHWICFADLNRMNSQKQRGGGALCFESKPVHDQFEIIIDETTECPS